VKILCFLSFLDVISACCPEQVEVLLLGTTEQVEVLLLGTT
jgi:hypothetical protein